MQSILMVQSAENTEKVKEENPLPEISPVRRRPVDILCVFF